jgi:hypothetical protein
VTKDVFLSYVERAKQEGKTLQDAVAEFGENFGEPESCWDWLGIPVEQREAKDPQ